MSHNTMPEPQMIVTGGVDTHRDHHAGAVVDHLGRVLATAIFPTTPTGYRQLANWIRSYGTVDKIGVEGTGSYGKSLTRVLTGMGINVVEVTRTNRQHRRRYGKNDVTDAIAAARAVLSGQATATPRGQDHSEALRILRIGRKSAVNHRTRIINQMKAVIITAPPNLRTRLDGLTNIQLVNTCTRFRPGPDPTNLTDTTKTVLKTLAGQWRTLGQDIKTLDQQTQTILHHTAPPEMLTQTGIGPVNAADLIITYGTNPDRIRNERAFAALCGVSAVDASSGLQQRHRLNRGGDRQANAALHRIIIVRLKHHPETRTYMTRRLQEGKTRKEIIRCLKRALARDIYHLPTQHQPPHLTI